MFINKSQLFTGLALAISVSAVSLAPAKADLPQPEKSQVMFGHSALVNIQENNFDAVVTGRVRGESGGIYSIEFINPETVTVDGREVSNILLPSPSWWRLQSGSDLVLGYKDGQWVYVADASRFPFDWLSRLNLKAVPTVEQVSIDWGESREVTLPPLAPSTAVEPAPAPEPVQGLW